MKDQYHFGLIGYKVGYSKSPCIFQAIFDHLGVQGRFEVIDVPPAEFPDAMRKLPVTDIQGASVTIPYKEQIISYLNDLDPVAQALQAVNSVHLTADGQCGFNTDCHGFSLPLRPHAERLKDGDALVLGYGGGARAALYALYADYEVSRCTVVGRDPERLRCFKQSMASKLPNLEINTRRSGTGRPTMGDPWAIVVNCTPLGGWNQPDESPLPTWLDWSGVRLYYDMNYNAGNILIAAANEAGVKSIDGSAMLVGQALQSFYIWTGRKLEFEPIYRGVFGE